jgi:hypothetical protein
LSGADERIISHMPPAPRQKAPRIRSEMCSSAKSVDRFTGLPRFAIHQYNWRQLTCVFLPLRRASISIISERVIERFFRSADRRGAGPKPGLERVAICRSMSIETQIPPGWLSAL